VLAPGRHTLVARIAGYRERRKILDDVRKAESEMLELDAMTGTILVDSVPQGLSVIIDGKENGGMTPLTLTLPAGKHRVGVVGGEEADVTVADGDFGLKIMLHGK